MHDAFSDMVHVLFLCNVCTGSCPAVADQGYHGKFFFFCFCFFALILSPLLEIPENAGVMKHT